MHADVMTDYCTKAMGLSSLSMGLIIMAEERMHGRRRICACPCMQDPIQNAALWQAQCQHLSPAQTCNRAAAHLGDLLAPVELGGRIGV